MAEEDPEKDVPKTPPKSPPKSRIPIPSSLYVAGGRSQFLADLSEQVYLEEGDSSDGDGDKKRRRRRRRKRSGEDGYGPPGILHDPKDKRKLRRRRPSSEFGDSSIELLGPSESLETDESDGTGDLLSESLEYDGPRGGSAAPRRYAEKKGAKGWGKMPKSKTLGGDPTDDEGRRQDKRQGSKKVKKGEKWSREPGRPMSTTGPSRSPSKSPAAERRKSVKGHGTGDSPRRYPTRDMSSTEKVEKWKEGAEDEEAKRQAKQSDKWRAPPAKTGKLEVPDGKGGVEWDPQEKYDAEDEYNKLHASKPPKPPFYGQGIDPKQLAEKLKEDNVRDAAAAMRLLQLCQSGDWYGVDGHLRYFEKRVASGQTKNTKPLSGVKDEASGWTPLMYAIKDNRIPICDRFLEMGCNVNAMARDGYYPIHLAALYGRDDTIRFLIYKKADATALTYLKQQNILHLAASRQSGNSGSILRALLAVAPKDARIQKDKDGNIPLVMALKNGLKGACQELLSAQVEEQLGMTAGESEDSPLHIAVRKKDLEICRVFVDCGCNVDAVNALGQTPLHIGYIHIYIS